jgi:hypothetical protein
MQALEVGRDPNPHTNGCFCGHSETHGFVDSVKCSPLRAADYPILRTMPFASPEMLRRRLQFALWSWAFTLVLVVSSWGLSMWINRTCEFVRIHETDPEDGSTVTFGRGIQQGQLLPRDDCMGWGKYEYLSLDPRMKTARAASALSVVSGPIVMVLLTVYLFLGRPWMSCTCKWLASFLSLANAIFQVLTHLMATSGLCQGDIGGSTGSTGTTYTVVDAGEADGSSPATASTCDTNTPTYRATYYTIVAWAIVAVVVAVAFPVQRVGDGSKDNSDGYDSNDDIHNGNDGTDGKDLETSHRSDADELGRSTC